MSKYHLYTSVACSTSKGKRVGWDRIRCVLIFISYGKYVSEAFRANRKRNFKTFIPDNFLNLTHRECCFKTVMRLAQEVINNAIQNYRCRLILTVEKCNFCRWLYDSSRVYFLISNWYFYWFFTKISDFLSIF